MIISISAMEDAMNANNAKNLNIGQRIEICAGSSEACGGIIIGKNNVCVTIQWDDNLFGVVRFDEDEMTYITLLDSE